MTFQSRTKQATTSPRHPFMMSGATLLVAALTLPWLAACGEHDSTQTVGQRLDAAVAKTEQTATEATESAKATVDQARTAMLDSVAGAKQSAERVNDALVRDRDDMAITASVSAGCRPATMSTGRPAPVLSPGIGRLSGRPVDGET